jgi:hypothetical protein
MENEKIDFNDFKNKTAKTILPFVSIYTPIPYFSLFFPAFFFIFSIFLILDNQTKYLFIALILLVAFSYRLWTIIEPIKTITINSVEKYLLLEHRIFKVLGHQGKKIYFKDIAGFNIKESSEFLLKDIRFIVYSRLKNSTSISISITNNKDLAQNLQFFLAQLLI